MRNINDLRETLLDTIAALRDKKIDVETAKAIGDLSQVVVNSAKVEVDAIRAGGGRSTFIPLDTEPPKKLERPKAEYSNKSAFRIASGE